MGIYARHQGEWYNVYEGGKAGSAGAAVIKSATGAVAKYSFEDSGQDYDVYEFTGSGELVVDEPGMVDALIVGGGGCAGQSCGGGGGAGGVFGKAGTALLVDENQKVVVGAGGAKRGTNASPGSGESSSVGNYVAVGGGAGATYSIAPQHGGSGGGGNGADYAGDEPGAVAVFTQGNNGGNGVAGGSTAAGGGGGGAGSSGSDGSGTTAGNGGDGIDVASFVGSPNELFIAAGGGAGSGGTGGKGGKGGGGDGVGGAGGGADGEINTGSAGGGGGNSVTSGGQGGSGIAIVRVKVSSPSFGPKTRSTAPKTAHAARIENGIVRQVIVIPHLDNEDAKITSYCNSIGLPGTWVDTSYTGSRRGKYAGVGDTFTMTRSGGEFVSPEIETVDTEETNV
jgi:hypothetical protein